jgi:two-component system response regulator (stage 0 sporulation protein F)
VAVDWTTVGATVFSTTENGMSVAAIRPTGLAWHGTCTLLDVEDYGRLHVGRMDVSNMLGKLLIAEDEDTLSYFLRQSLEDSTPSFRVEVVGAGDEALKKVVAGHFDLMVVDLRLPVMDGLSLIKAVRQFDPFIKVIVMTAYGSPEMEKEVRKLGIHGFVTKPFVVEDMKRMITRVVAGTTLYTGGAGA